MKECLVAGELSKLAAEEILIQGLLLPLYPEHEDSGIDSDDSDYELAGAGLNAWHPPAHSDGEEFAESTSSDEDGALKKARVRCVEPNNNSKNWDESWMESPEVLIPMLPRQRSYCEHRQPGFRNSPDRSSPPLYEVELTASDEEDDASVLELVIPMQKSYKRVPTSSPIKRAIESPKFFCGLLCCFRK